MALKTIFPTLYKYNIIYWNVIGEDKFDAEIKIALKNIYDFKLWLKEFEEKTNTTWILKHNAGCDDRKKLVVNRSYVCQHYRKKRTKNDGSSKKGKSCKAAFSVLIKWNTKFLHYKDPHVGEGYTGTIKMHYEHSHLINNAEAWNCLRRSEDTKDLFVNYFSNGMSPSDSIMYHEDVLFLENPELLANSRKNPPKAWVYALYENWSRKNYGIFEFTDLNLPSIANQKIEYFKQKGCQVEISEDPFCVTLLTPLMQRQFMLLQSCCSLFIDSSASCDEGNNRLTIILVATKIGLVPIGAAIHSSHTEESYFRAFCLLRQQWDGIRKLEIENFMIDDSVALKSALHSVFPDVPVLLCHSHVLQTVWMWLCDVENTIAKVHRKDLMKMFRHIMFAKNELEIQQAVDEMMLNDAARSYPHFIHFVESNYLPRKSEWCFAYRLSIQDLHYNTNNYSDATFRILKDIIVTHLRTCKTIAIIDYLVNVMDKYYCKRMLDIVYNKQCDPYNLFEKFSTGAKKILEECVVEKFENFYVVQSETDMNIFYEVDIGMCTCNVATQGAFCVHQCAVQLKYKIDFPNSPCFSSKDKENLFKLAVGTNTGTPVFFIGMMDVKQADGHQQTSECSSIKKEKSEESETNHGTSVNGAQILTALKLEMRRMEQIFEHNLKNESLVEQASRFVKECAKIESAAQLGSFFKLSSENSNSVFKLCSENFSIKSE